MSKRHDSDGPISDATVAQRLQDMALALPTPPKPLAAYVPAVRSGNLVVVSGQLPLRDGELIATGKVPSQVSAAQARTAAEQCMLNALAVLRQQIGGDWAGLRRIVRVGVFVQRKEHEPQDHDE